MPTYVRVICAQSEVFMVEMHKLAVTDVLAELMQTYAASQEGQAPPTEAPIPGAMVVFPVTVNLPLRATTVALVLQWIDNYFAEGQFDALYQQGIGEGETAPYYLPAWEAQFFAGMHPDQIARIAHAADYLEIHRLHDMANKALANVAHNLDDQGLGAFISAMAPHTTDQFI